MPQCLQCLSKIDLTGKIKTNIGTLATRIYHMKSSQEMLAMAVVMKSELM